MRNVLTQSRRVQARGPPVKDRERTTNVCVQEKARSSVRST